MGVGSSFNCCKNIACKKSVIFDIDDYSDDDQQNKKEENKNNNANETTSNNNTNEEYTFKGKSSINSKNSVIVGNNNYINNEVFKPDNIPDKHPKESQYSFNAMFQNLD